MLDIPATSPLLVFGGPYSNLPATRALLGEARRLAIPPSHIVCTGDVVAYCAEPEQTASLVRASGMHVVAGNCEESLAAGAEDCGCNFDEDSACNVLAKSWFEYAAARVSPESRRWMAALPSTLRLRYADLELLVVHGGRRETARWVFASDSAIIAEELAACEADLVVAGHCGVPFLGRCGSRTWFNPGVIGVPANEGLPRVWYGLITPTGDGLEISTHPLAYDHAAAAATLRRAGYAEPYARALETGLWPSLDILPTPERAMTGVPLTALRATVGVRGGILAG